MKKHSLIFSVILLNCIPSLIPRPLTLTKLETIKHSKKQFSDYQKTFWWQIFPTTGLRLEKPFWPLTYPFLPHAFSLWELAPSLGKGITVCLIDTGIAAFTFTHKGKVYTQHPDLLIEGNFSNTNYNMLPFEERSINPYKNLIELIHYYSTEPTTQLITTQLPTWLRDYATSKKTTGIDAYLHTYAKPHLLQKNKKSFSQEGLRAHRKIIHGDCGFKQFPLIDLKAPYNQPNALIPFIPIPDMLPANPLTLQWRNNDHGTHVASIIGGRLHPDLNTYTPFTTHSCRQLLLDDTGFCGLAPKCSLFMIKGLHAGTTNTNPAHILDALYAARALSPAILNLSCKYDHPAHMPKKLADALEKEIKQFQYVCASGGNDALEKELSYPARYDSILFSVGAFECHYDAVTKKYTCPLCPFSQHEKEKGPFYVAPGKDILGCSFTPNSHEALYALYTGTSYATPIMTGFLALMLGHYKDDFTQEQLLFVCQNACLRLHTTPAWKTQVIYGVVDMRTALFTLHVAKKLFTENPSFTKKWKKVFTAIFTFLYEMADAWGRQQDAPCSFKEGFIDYFNAVHAKTPCTLLTTEPFTSVEKASAFTCAAVLKKLTI